MVSVAAIEPPPVGGRRKQRHVTLRVGDLVALWAAFRDVRRSGVVLLRADQLEGQLTPQHMLDIVVPHYGRFGPIDSLVVRELPDGSTAVRLDELPDRLATLIQEAGALVEQARLYLLQTGALSDGNGQTRHVTREARKTRRYTRGLTLPPHTTAVQRSGSLTDGSLRRVLLDLATERATGVLTVDLPAGVRRIGFWQRGGPVGWRSEPIQQEDVLGMLLFRSNRITKEQLAASIDLMNERDLRQGDALVELGAIEPSEVARLLHAQCGTILGRVLDAADGTWSFGPVEEHDELFVTMPLQVAPILFRHERERAERASVGDIAAQMRPYLDMYAFLTRPAVRIASELKLKPGESRLLPMVEEGTRRVRELFSVSPLNRASTAILLSSLIALGLIECRAAASSVQGNQELRRELLALKKHCQTGTLFERLNVHWLCLDGDVESAWRAFTARFGPHREGSFGSDATSDHAFVLQKAREAYELLKDPEARRAYRPTVISRDLLNQSVKILLSRADMALMRMDYAEAIASYARALELFPGRPDLVAAMDRVQSMGRT